VRGDVAVDRVEVAVARLVDVVAPRRPRTHGEQADDNRCDPQRAQTS
jgi:hypothetical protein